MGKPLVSVIMPVYNAAEFLPDSIGDVLQQSLTDFELICVNDGSSDDSKVILDGFSQKDSRVFVITQNNQGGGAARNTGFLASKGKYVIFLDADDRFERELLSDVVAKAEETESEVLAFDADVFDNDTGARKSAPWLIRGNENIVVGNPFEILNTSVWNKLFLREFLMSNELRFAENNRYSDTMSFVAKALLLSDKTIILKRVLLHYRINNSNSLIANQHKDYLAVYKNLEEIKDWVELEHKDRKSYFNTLAEMALMGRLRVMNDKIAYFSLYKYLHGEGLRSLGFEKAEDFSDSRDGRGLRAVLTKELADYLYDNIQKLKICGMLENETFILPQEIIDKNCVKPIRIALYGAGNAGRDYFRQIMNCADLRISCWVDKNYERIGFPVTSPHSLSNNDFDYVIIAVSDEKIARVVTEELVDNGIEREKVLWKKTDVIE